MINIFTYKIMYFIISLILGFFLGYVIKKNSFQKRIEEDIENKEKLFDSTSQTLKDINKQLIESENRFKINNDLVSTQKDVMQKLNTEILTTKQKIVNLEEAKVDLTSKYDELKIELEQYKDKISTLKPQYESAESDSNQNEILLKKQKLLQDKLNTSNSELENFIKNLEEKDKSYKQQQDILLKIDNEIKLLNTKFEELQNKDSSSKTQNSIHLQESAKELRIKVLNYKYEISDLKDKISKGINISDEHINNFISKNENERFIDKILSNIFSKKGDK